MGTTLNFQNGVNPFNGIPDLTGTIDVDRKTFIDAGGFSDIFSGYFKTDMSKEKKLALKILRSKEVRDYADSEDSTKAAERRTNREVQLMIAQKSPDNKNVLDFLGIARDVQQGKIALVIPWMKNGSVIEFIHRTEDIEIAPLVMDVSRGLTFLHGRKILHGDLRGQNILVNDEGYAVICDFGRSYIMDEVDCTKSFAGSTKWLAPEILLEETKDFSEVMTAGADIWAFAITTVELYTDLKDTWGGPRARQPADVFLRMQKMEVPARQDRGTNTKIPDNLWPILHKCWDYDPEKRPRAGEVKDDVCAALSK